MTKFELDKEQQARVDAWFDHHWGVVHKGFRPRGDSPVVCQYVFGPTGIGCNAKVVCAWCNEGYQGHECDLTLDDDGEFIIQYDENWNQLPWEKKT